MNKKLHIFLFLLSILLIFCLLKNIEPFGNQILLQPGLSFDSRDTTIVTLQGDPEIDNSDEMTLQNEDTTTSGRRIPSAVEERDGPSYSVFEDTSGNQGSSMDTLSPDFNSPEEIQLLNERLEDLQSKLDDVGELFVSEGIKKQCTIPEGIYNSYVIENIGGDETPETRPVTQGEKYDYDFFTGATTIRCAEQSDREDFSVSPSITCDGPSEEFFTFSGCKRVCTLPDTIPLGYMVENENMGDGTDYNAGNTFSNDFFSDKVTCSPNYSSGEGDGVPSITCEGEGQYEFQFQGCKKQCVIPEYDITTYIPNDGISDSLTANATYDFDYFTTNQDAFSCANTGQEFKAPCNDDDIYEFKFEGCEKQCRISQDDMNAYKVLNSDGDEELIDGLRRDTFDYNAFNRETGREYYLTCTDDYVSWPETLEINDNEDELQDIINYRGIYRNDLEEQAYSNWVNQGYRTSYPTLENISSTFRGNHQMRGYHGNDIGEKWMDLPSMTCVKEGEEIFALSVGARECRKKRCRIPSNGYDYSDGTGLYVFDHFDINTNIQGISCAENYEGSDIQINPTEGEVTYDNMCDEDGYFRFTGCEKRQCTIPDGYSDGTENRLYDFDHFSTDIQGVSCAEGYEGDEGDGNGIQIIPTEEGVTYDNMCDEYGFFRFTGCVQRQCTIPNLNENMITIDDTLLNTDTIDYGSRAKIKCNEHYHLEKTEDSGDTWRDVDTGSEEIRCDNEFNDNIESLSQYLRCSENECKFPYNKIENNYIFQPKKMDSDAKLRDLDNQYSITGLTDELNKIECRRDFYELLKNPNNDPWTNAVEMSDAVDTTSNQPISITCPENEGSFKFTGCEDCPLGSEINPDSELCECKKDDEKVSYIGDLEHMRLNNIEYQILRKKTCINNKNYFIDTYYNKKYQLWTLLLSCWGMFLCNLGLLKDLERGGMFLFIILVVLIPGLLVKEDTFDDKIFYAYTTWIILIIFGVITYGLSFYRIFFKNGNPVGELLCILGILFLYNVYAISDYIDSYNLDKLNYQKCPKDSTTKYNKDKDEFKCECDDIDKDYKPNEEDDGKVGRCVHKKEGDKLSFWIFITISVSVFFGTIKVIVGLNNDDRKAWGTNIILITLIIILIFVRLCLHSYLNWSW